MRKYCDGVVTVSISYFISFAFVNKIENRDEMFKFYLQFLQFRKMSLLQCNDPSRNSTLIHVCTSGYSVILSMLPLLFCPSAVLLDPRLVFFVCWQYRRSSRTYNHFYRYWHHIFGHGKYPKYEKNTPLNGFIFHFFFHANRVAYACFECAASGLFARCCAHWVE